MPNRLPFHPATLMACLFALCLAACGKEKGANAGRGETAPPDTYESLTAELIDLNNAFGDTLAGVSDADEARVALPQLEKLGVQFERLAVRMEKLGVPEGAKRAEIGAMLADSKIQLKKKATRLSSLMLSKANVEIGEVLHEGIENLGIRLSQFAILEEWSNLTADAKAPAATGASAKP